ncbi:hypothetical protein HXA31_00535 [Salipaludibacillus agaradhaerens]|uniref:Uncharacterized protein n=1 Tax=Salipaludibacillus agaradhaerens TaxID=76935 RepID=A0A9Q4FZQ1_SALAG|nr:hypothetical protein [Salipaludibacillus agaradhaerens]MCR6097666.1 hypothetical protein [Salipaludibacillus agaradhaerens]MCR6112850.1 hypothetical protein [Salipaludibacillus agaradhaerens]
MSNSTSLKFLSGCLQLFFSIPLISFLYIVWMFQAYPIFQLMFIVHLITLIVSLIERRRFYGSVLGMTASLIGGDEISMEGFFLLHTGVTIIIFHDAFKSRKTENAEAS